MTEPRSSAWNILSAMVGFVTRVLVPVFLIVLTAYWGRTFGEAIYMRYFRVPDDRITPRLVGKNVRTAEQILERVGLTMHISETCFSEFVPRNLVMGQDPPAGRDVREGTGVGVVVSLGGQGVGVPSVLGKGLSDAELALHNAKLRPGTVTRVKRNPDDPEEVLDQSPKPGAIVKEGTHVNLLVNVGSEERVAVPSFATKPIDQVREAVTAANLRVGSIKWVLSDSVDPGQVINQDPLPTTFVKPGTEVNLRVSMGNTTSPPDLRQRTITVRAQDVDGPQDIRVVVDDTMGEHTSFEATMYKGDRSRVFLNAIGRGEYEIYSGQILITRGQI